MRGFHSGKSEREHQRKGCFGSFHGEWISRDHLSEPGALSSVWTNMAVCRHSLISDAYQHPLMSFLCLVLTFVTLTAELGMFLHFSEYKMTNMKKNVCYNITIKICLMKGDWCKHGSKFNQSDREFGLITDESLSGNIRTFWCRFSK